MEAAEGRRADPHLRSFVEVRGYRVRAGDGTLGRVHDLLFDDEWHIHGVEVQTRAWAAKHRVMVPTDVVARISWRTRAFVLLPVDAAARWRSAPDGPRSASADREVALAQETGSAELSTGEGGDQGLRTRPGLSGRGTISDDMAMRDAP